MIPATLPKADFNNHRDIPGPSAAAIRSGQNANR